MQGRLQGKRLHGRYFADHVVDHGTEGCNYLLAVDVDMNTVGGYAISSWERGTATWSSSSTSAPSGCSPTCRPRRWSSATWSGSTTPPSSSRRGPSSRRQLDRVRRAGLGRAGRHRARVHRLRHDVRGGARTRRYRDLTPVNQYNVDYSILGTSRVEPLLRAIRNTMYDAGLDVEGAKGECNFGQHEIGFLYADALTTADNHASTRPWPRRSPPSRASRSRSWRSTTSARAAPATSTSRCAARRRRWSSGTPTRADAPRSTTTSSPGVLATVADFTLLYAPEHQLLQAVRGRLVRADDDRLGPRQPHLRGPAGRATAPAPGWRTGCPAPT